MTKGESRNDRGWMLEMTGERVEMTNEKVEDRRLFARPSLL